MPIDLIPSSIFFEFWVSRITMLSVISGSRQFGLSESTLNLAQQMLVLELPRRQVHRHRQRGRDTALEGLVLRARDPEHPGSDRNDQPRVLRVPDELQGRKQSELGMLPPDQRLHARDPAGIDLDLGFVV